MWVSAKGSDRVGWVEVVCGGGEGLSLAGGGAITLSLPSEDHSEAE